MKTLGLSKVGIAVGVALAFSLWTVVLYILLADENLSADSKKLLTKSSSISGEEAYYFLMGFDVAAEDDPITEGKALAEKIQIENEKYLNGKTDSITETYPKHKKLVITNEALFCKYWEDGCYKTLFENVDFLNESQPIYILVTKRFSKFLAFNDYQTPTRNTIIEPKPSYKLMTNANRLILANNIKLANMGEIDTAVYELLEHIDKLRTALSSTDDLIGKLVFLNELAESIDILAILNHKYRNNRPINLAQLTSDELSLESPLKSEFGSIYGIYQNLSNTKNSPSIPGWVSTALIRLTFKPNMTINYHSKEIEILIACSKSPKSQKSTEISTPDFSILNIVGAKLYLKSRGVFDEYLPRTQSLNIKIALLNSAFKDGNLQKSTFELINPFYGKPEMAEFLTNKICLKGPTQDKKGFNCLQIDY